MARILFIKMLSHVWLIEMKHEIDVHNTYGGGVDENLIFINRLYDGNRI